MPTMPSIDPTDRSMLRLTMMSTMPVAMTATDAVCTERFQRFWGERNLPFVPMPKMIQMMTSAATMPSSRVSTSAERSIDANERVAGAGAGGATEGAAPGTSAMFSAPVLIRV